MPNNVENVIVERLKPEPFRSNDELIWRFDTKGELHTFVTRLYDLILNEINYKEIKYVGERIVFKPKGKTNQQIEMLTRNLTLTLCIEE
jgi:hypothetical protein